MILVFIARRLFNGCLDGRLVDELNNVMGNSIRLRSTSIIVKIADARRFDVYDSSSETPCARRHDATRSIYLDIISRMSGQVYFDYGVSLSG